MLADVLDGNRLIAVAMRSRDEYEQMEPVASVGVIVQTGAPPHQETPPVWRGS
tara:strand:+ start:7857 stop:8015 length:159 start_codon:yes stop_codon:yes gene_type:complete